MSKGIFNHIQIKVKNLAESHTFYEPLMAILGHKVVLHIEGSVIGYGTSKHDMFEIRQETNAFQLSSATHIAFNAKDQQCVKDFYTKALTLGGACHGEPGFRQYEEGYYAAFVIDPDGHNIEAVFSGK